MKDRCYNKKHASFKYYGARKIRILWDSYISFRQWALANGYEDSLNIDRLNNNGNYEPSNCRWVTTQINNRNRSCIKLSQEKADRIRKLYSKGIRQCEIARQELVDPRQVWSIIRGHIWNPI